MDETSWHLVPWEGGAPLDQFEVMAVEVVKEVEMQRDHEKWDDPVEANQRQRQIDEWQLDDANERP